MTSSSEHSPKSSRLGELTRLARFGMTGGFVTACMYGLFCLLVWLGVNHTLALAADYLGGVALGYVINSRWTFADRESAPGSRTRYVLVYLLIFALNAALLEVGVRALELDARIAQLPALAIATGASYILQRTWVFRSAANKST